MKNRKKFIFRLSEASENEVFFVLPTNTNTKKHVQVQHTSNFIGLFNEPKKKRGREKLKITIIIKGVKN